MSDSSNQKLWFKAQNYGYGWYPNTWQGSIILLAYLTYLALKVANFIKDTKGSSEPTGEMVGVFLLDILFATAFLIIICYLSGEKPRWRWGK